MNNQTQIVDLDALSLSDLVDRYINMDRYVSAEKKRMDDFFKPYSQQLDQIKTILSTRMSEEGLDKVASKNGTCYRSNLLNPKVADQDKFLRWCIENWTGGGSDMLKVGAPQVETVRVYMDEHEGQLPPGVAVSPFSRINIRPA